MNELDILTERIRAQVTALGMDGAIALYSNPKSPKKVTARQLEAILAGEQEPTLRMAKVELERAKELVDSLNVEVDAHNARAGLFGIQMNELRQTIVESRLELDSMTGKYGELVEETVRLRLELAAKPAVGTLADRQSFPVSGEDIRSSIVPPAWEQNPRAPKPVKQVFANVDRREGMTGAVVTTVRTVGSVLI